jgi:hypothetical protein
MRRPEEIRTAPRDWIPILKLAHRFLVNQGVGNLILFGSQALSFYLRRELRSKDLDLVTDQFRPRFLEDLSHELRKLSGCEVRSTSVQTRLFDDGRMRTYSLEMRVRRRPFFVEVFDAVLDGFSPLVLAPHVRLGRRWGLRLWVPTPSALVALRLCYREPERISPPSADRLNRFIRENRRRIRYADVANIIAEWRMGQTVSSNLSELERIHKRRIIDQEKILGALAAT